MKKLLLAIIGAVLSLILGAAGVALMITYPTTVYIFLSIVMFILLVILIYELMWE